MLGPNMGRIPNKAKTFRDSAHKNFMGGLSYDIKNPLIQLRVAASSCFFGEPMYYHKDEDDKRPVRRGNPLPSNVLKHLSDTLDNIDPQEWRGLSPAELLEKAIDTALDHDVEATLAYAVELRNVEMMRTTPQVILVRASHNKNARGTGLIKKYAKDIIKRADEPSVCLAYNKWRFGRRSIPNSLKKGIAEALQGFDEYQLSKYKMAGSEFKAVDVVNLVRPKHTDAIGKLMRGELTTTNETWESIVSAEGASKESWMKSIPKMGHMALLRNIRNFTNHDVPYGEYLDKLIKTAENGKQLPFRYYSAYKAVEGAPGPVLDAIETCLDNSVGNLPRFNGKVMSLCDNSGSAHGTMTSAFGTVKVSEIANLTGILTAKCADEGYLGIFGDRLDTFSIRFKSSVFDDLKKAENSADRIGQGTENGIWTFWDKAIKEKEHWDHVFVYSDMQAGHGGLYGHENYSEYVWGGGYGGYGGYGRHPIDVPKLINKYRKDVNPNVMVYLVQVAGYQDTIMPEFYDKTFILGGWSAGVIKFASHMNSMMNGNMK